METDSPMSKNMLLRIWMGYLRYWIRYLYTGVVVVYVCVKTGALGRTFLSGVELLALFFLTELLRRKHNGIANVVGTLGCLLLNIQLFVLLFGNSYVTLVMLVNLGSAEDLSGKAAPILTATALTIIFTFWPSPKDSSGGEYTA